MTEQAKRESGLDRRSALKMATAAGASAWVAPAITSTTVHASGDTCTPKCRPAGSTGATATITKAECGGNGNSRTVTIEGEVALTQAFSCPCSDAPASVDIQAGSGCSSTFGTCSSEVVGDVLKFRVVNTGKGRTGDIRFTFTATATCPDRSPDDGNCSLTCTTTVSIDVSLQDNGNCNSFRVGTATVAPSCN